MTAHFEQPQWHVAQVINAQHVVLASRDDRPSVPQWRLPPKPLDFVERPVEYAALLQALLAPAAHAIAITALHGAGGYGKTILALAACYDPQVRAAFSEGICWVTLGQQPNMLLAISEVIEQIAGYHPLVTTIEEAQCALATIVSGRRCLLVIDDVWDRAHLLPFLQGSEGCTRLVTTRNGDILPRMTISIEMAAMDRDQSVALLSRDLALPEASYQQIIPLAEQLGGWPLRVFLVKGMLDAAYQQGLLLREAIAEVMARLAVDDTPLRTMTVIAASVAALPARLRARYVQLGIFPSDIAIPFAAIGVLWQETIADVRERCLRLAQRSLIAQVDWDHQTLMLHDEMYAYIAYAYRDEMPNWHAQFLAASRLDGGWGALPEGAYLWSFLSYHLLAAGQGSELVQTLSDVRYLVMKVALLSGLALEEDIGQALRQFPEDRLLQMLEQQVRWSAAALARCHTRREIAQVFFAAWGHLPPLAVLVPAVRQFLQPPYVRPLHARLFDVALLRTFVGHHDWVECGVFSPDGRQVLSASADHTLCLWETASGRLLRTFVGHQAGVRCGVFSPDGRQVLSASADHTLCLWETASGRLLRTFEGHQASVYTGVMSPDGHAILSASSDGTLRLWETVSGRLLRTFVGHQAGVRAGDFSPDGRRIISASFDQTLKLWETATGMVLQTFAGHTDRVNSGAFSSDGRLVISTSNDGTLRLWETTSGQLLRIFEGHTDRVTYGGFRANNQQIMSTSADGTVRLWDTASGQEIRQFHAHAGWVNSGDGSPDGQLLISACGDHTLRLWAIALPEEDRRWMGHTKWVNDGAFFPSGKHVISASSDQLLVVWDVQTGHEVCRLHGHRGWVVGVAVHPDGAHVLSASYDGTLRLWDVASGNVIQTFVGHRDRVTQGMFHPDGAHVLSASYDGTLRLWDVASGNVIQTFAGHMHAVMSGDVSSDGAWVIAGLADGTLRLWERRSGKVLQTFAGHTDTVHRVAFHPLGQQILSASADGTIRMWDARSGTCLRVLTGHQGVVWSGIWGSDGKVIFSVSGDGTLKLWDSEQGTLLLSYAMDEALTCCALSPDGTHLVVGGLSGSVYLLQLYWG